MVKRISMADVALEAGVASASADLIVTAQLGPVMHRAFTLIELLVV